MASGYALARRRPSFALLHTTPGFGNAVNAIATSRVNRTPIVIAIGQQDRRHIAFEPFLAGTARRPGGRLSRLGLASRLARRTFPARSSAPTTRRRPTAGLRS